MAARLLEGWGEEKRAYEWLKDPRCAGLSRATLMARICNGWSTHLALSTPVATPASTRKGLKFEAFGEWKTLAQWSRDSRCVVTSHILLSRTRELGYPLKKALTEPAVRGLTAFGETKRISAWALDERCSVGYHTLYRRVRRLGWDAERAITEPRKR